MEESENERTRKKEKNAHQDPVNSEEEKKKERKEQEIDVCGQTEKKEKQKSKEINPTHEKSLFVCRI